MTKRQQKQQEARWKRLKKKVVKHHEENLRHLQTCRYVYTINALGCTAVKKNNRKVDVGISGHDCAFCQEVKRILKTENVICSAGCPIWKKTGGSGCRYTPWRDIYKAFVNKDIKAAIAAEIEEIEFLKSL
jgi:hypothetical protein